MSTAVTTDTAPTTYREAAQQIVPFAILMGLFTLAYSIWFGVAWGVAGWILTGIMVIASFYLLWKNYRNLQHLKRFKLYKSPEGRRLSQSMALLIGISCAMAVVIIIILIAYELVHFILPFLSLMVGVHFIQQASITTRQIDYMVAPLPIISSFIASYFAFQTGTSWMEVFAIAGLGGAAASVIYGFYLTASYRKLAEESGVESPQK